MRNLREKFIGDKAFYKMVLMIALPIMLQNGITCFVNLLDNVMVGQLGTEQMSGVAIVNQLINIYNLCIFGALSGASLFGSQFYGRGNHDGLRYTFRFKLLNCIALTLVITVVFLETGDSMISLFLNGNSDGGDVMLTHSTGMTYLKMMLVGLIPYVIAQTYASTLREIGQTMVPMLSSTAAVFTNLVLNYVLIFGKFGAPALGVEGAAIATVISRFVEMFIVIAWTHAHSHTYIFIQGVYRSMHIPMSLASQIIQRGTPLLINEAMFSTANAILVQCYSTRGLTAIAALNISTTISQLFNVAVIALGSSIGIIIGQLLGAGKIERAVDTDRKMIFFSVAGCIFVGALMFVMAPLFPEMYNTSKDVQTLAVGLIRILSIFMPVMAFYNASYFTLRAGGKTGITFLFDGCYLVAVNVTVAFCLSRFTAVPILTMFFINYCMDIPKVILGLVLIKKRVWVHNIVADF